MTDSSGPPGPVSVPGWHTPRARASEREPLSTDQILEGALRVIDTEGLQALSMRRLGHELGAGATSLYWHVKNKDELLDLLVDKVIGDVLDEVQPAEGWREGLASSARAFRRVLLRHHHLAPVVGERPTLGPNALRTIEWLIGLMRGSGFDELTCVLAANAVLQFTGGYTVFEARDPISGPAVTEEERAVYIEAVGGLIATLPPDQFPNLIALAPRMATITPDEQFEYGLQRLLDGIEGDRRPDSPVGR